MLIIHFTPVLCIKLQLNVSFLPAQSNKFPFAAEMDVKMCIFPAGDPGDLGWNQGFPPAGLRQVISLQKQKPFVLFKPAFLVPSWAWLPAQLCLWAPSVRKRERGEMLLACRVPSALLEKPSPGFGLSWWAGNYLGWSQLKTTVKKQSKTVAGLETAN